MITSSSKMIMMEKSQKQLVIAISKLASKITLFKSSLQWMLMKKDLGETDRATMRQVIDMVAMEAGHQNSGGSALQDQTLVTRAQSQAADSNL